MTVSFFDLETNTKDSICDIGCVRWDNAIFHENSIQKFVEFIKDSDFIAGHNVFKHDLGYIHQSLGNTFFGSNAIDTLYLSPLLFPKKPYHHLLKDEKLQVDELNNPVNDSVKARDHFFDEVATFKTFRSIFN